MYQNILYQTQPDSTNYETRVSSNHPRSSVGGMNSKPSKRSILINEIRTLRLNTGTTQPSVGPNAPSIRQQTPTVNQYSLEDLQGMSLQELQELYDELTTRLPLSQKFNKKDRELASKSEEYKQALKKYERGAKSKREIEPVDLS